MMGRIFLWNESDQSVPSSKDDVIRNILRARNNKKMNNLINNINTNNNNNNEA